MKNNILIIGEAGVNHNGDINNAFKLIDAAVAAKVDYVKFQTFKAANLVSKDARKAEYQISNTSNENDTQLEMLRKLELSHSQHEQLIEYCEKKGIKFFSTAFDLLSLDYLAQIGLKLVKIPSGEITNLPYLKKAASLFEEVIISTGMCMMSEIKDALNVFIKAGISKNKITILHCNTEYPTPMKDVNLKAMLSIGNEFGVKVGYSDHTLGIEVPIAAVALGATIIEKHFTLDKNLPGPDHAASLEPHELIEMCKAIRNIELALSGSGIKEPSESEIKNINIARKSIVARVNIAKGTTFTEDNITTKRPANGISAMKWDDVLGTIAIRDFNEDDLLEL
jgi:N-acetylneuraminate synthase